MIIPASAKVGKFTDLRFLSDDILIGENVVFDDFVRIVVPQGGRLVIGNGVKLGIGAVINCGGSIEMGNNVSFYGYCYVQSSRWLWNDVEKEYSYYNIKIGDFATLAPNTVISGSVVVPGGYRSRPGEVLGEW